MTITYKLKQAYGAERSPAVCLGHGDRTAYVLTDDAIEALRTTLGVSLSGDYDVTLNLFADGYANLMRLGYSNVREEFFEKEVHRFAEEELANLTLEWD